MVVHRSSPFSGTNGRVPPPPLSHVHSRMPNNKQYSTHCIARTHASFNRRLNPVVASAAAGDALHRRVHAPRRQLVASVPSVPSAGR